MLVTDENISSVAADLSKILDGAKFCYDHEGNCIGKLEVDFSAVSISIEDNHSHCVTIEVGDDVIIETWKSPIIIVYRNNNFARWMQKELGASRLTEIRIGSYDSAKYSEYLRRELFWDLRYELDNWLSWAMTMSDMEYKDFEYAETKCTEVLENIQKALESVTDTHDHRVIGEGFDIDWPKYVKSGNLDIIFKFDGYTVNTITDLFNVFDGTYSNEE